MKSLLRLGVNVDHVATLRQARGTAYPDPTEAAELCMRSGAEGVTVHLREDRRHIQEEDVRRLCARPGIPVNLEMAHHPAVLAIALELRPKEVCLVPERREEITTEGGLDAAGQETLLRPCVEALKAAGVSVSLFVEPDFRQLEAARRLGAPCIELHTGKYCDAGAALARVELERLIHAAVYAHGLGLQVNAGHGIHLGNIPGILEIPHLDTLNIGHSLVSRAVFVGLGAAVTEMRAAMDGYGGGRRP